jgi:glycine cleavage system H protein
MDALLTTLQYVGIFIAGLVVRFGLLVVVLAALTLVFLAGLAIVRGAGFLRRKAQGVSRVDGVFYQDGPYYAPWHIWVRAAGDKVLNVGLDDLAERLIPGLAQVTLPSPGSVLRAGQPLAEVACGNKRATLAAPVDGKVVAVNDAVRRDPSLARRDPYRRGWLVKMEVPDTRYTSLVHGQKARAWMDQEAIRLAHFLEGQLSMAAADGGELLAPGPSFLNDEQWQALTRAFLAPAEAVDK